MTYCAAWKKDDKVFLVSDTAISNEKKESEYDIGSFGERFGIYDNYSVKESKIKIVKVNEKIAIAFSGIVKNAKEAINSFLINIEFNSIEKSLKKLEESNENSDFELIIISSEEKNCIYYFNGLKVIEINDYVDIGSGKDKEYFSKNISYYINSPNKLIELNRDDLLLRRNYDFDAEEHLVDVLAYIQTLSLSDNLIEFGAGGLFFGLYIENEIKWCRDLLYYIYDDSLSSFRTVSVNERLGMVFSYSDYNRIFRCYSNDISEYGEIVGNKYLQKSIYKSLVESFSDYVILYNKSSSNIIVNKINKWPYNTFFKIWLKRNEDNTKYAFAFSYYYEILKEFIDDMNGDVKLYNIACPKEYFTPREDYVGQFTIDDVDDIEVEYDYDLRSLDVEYKGINEFIYMMDKNVCEQHNIVIIDYRYLFDTILEKYNEYNFAQINLKNLNLESLITTCFRNIIASSDFERYGFYIIKDKNDPCIINDFSIYDWICSYNNCKIHESLNSKSKVALSKFTFEAIKKYYFDERYFGIDKLIICCDNIEINEVLSYAPKKNVESENPDIFLIRNFNHDTNIDGRFKYCVLNYVIPYMMGYNYDQIRWLEAGYDPNSEEYN